MNFTKEQWRERILSAWEVYGTGKPLDPRTVEGLAEKFAKPLPPIPVPRFRTTPCFDCGYGPCQMNCGPAIRGGA